MEIQDVLFTKPGPEFAKRGHSDNAESVFSQLLERSSDPRGDDDAIRSERFAESDRPGRRDHAHVRNDHSHHPEHARSDDRPTRQADQSTREIPNDTKVSDAPEPKDQPAQANEPRGNRRKDSETTSSEAASTATCATGRSDPNGCGDKQPETEIATAAADVAPATLPAAAEARADSADAAAGAEQVKGPAAPTGQAGISIAPDAQATLPSAIATASAGAPQNTVAAPKVGNPQTATKTDGSPASNVQDPNSVAGPDTAKAAEAAPKSSGQTTPTDPAPGKAAEQAAGSVTVKPAPQKEQSQSATTAPTAPDHSVAKGATAKPDNGPAGQSNATAGNAQNAAPTNGPAQAPGSAGGAAAASAAGTPDAAPAGTAESDVSQSAPTTSDGSNLVLTANREGGTNVAHARPMQLNGISVNNIAVHIRRAVAGGQDHLRIRLHPAELGDVDVRMKIAHDGAVRVIVSVDRPETFDLMQRDARGLERALQDAGLKTDSGSLSFNLRDNGPGGFNGREAAPYAEPSPGTPSESLPAIESAEQELVLQPGIVTRALDIRV